MVAPAPARIVRNGRIAELHRARKPHLCVQCRLLIEAGEHYYSVIYAGAGLGNIKFPDRVHEGCVEVHLNGSSH